MRRATAIAAGLLLAAGAAEAQPRAHRDQRVGLAIAPLKLLQPVGEIQVEVLISNTFSAVAIAGFGLTFVETDAEEGTDTARFTTLVAGLQLRAYFHGSSEEGGYAALEGRYVSQDGPGTGFGLSLGPVLGYKWAWEHLFVDLNGGIGFHHTEAESTREGVTATASEQDAVPLVNLTVGWGF